MLHLKTAVTMKNSLSFEVIVIGGSYAGLSAALTLGRSLRKVLVIDAGQPCNSQTPYAHNFITHDGSKPFEIARLAKDQVLKYPTVSFLDDLVTSVRQGENTAVVETASGESFIAKKILLATGVLDLMPATKGFKECWGISVLHCPYCHGFEVRNKKIGLFGNGDSGFELVKLIQHWSKDLILFTNGSSSFSLPQIEVIKKLNIAIVEDIINEIEEERGQVKKIALLGGSNFPLDAIFARVPFKQSSSIAAELGCELSETNLIKANEFGKTNLAHVFAAGDNSSPIRSLSVAVANGMKAGVWINRELMESELS
jgi:thioredoxin reductase